MPNTPESTAKQANRLYWETEQSVADIAQELDISRRALYNAVQPMPTGGTCDVCGGELVYENRSARLADHPTCPACAEADGADETVEPVASDDSSAPDAAGAAQPAIIAGAALAGALVGAAVTLAVVRRR